jgi:hypothetical protein
MRLFRRNRTGKVVLRKGDDEMSELRKRLEFVKQIALIAKKAKEGEEWALEDAKIEIARLIEKGESECKDEN